MMPNPEYLKHVRATCPSCNIPIVVAFDVVDAMLHLNVVDFLNVVHARIDGDADVAEYFNGVIEPTANDDGSNLELVHFEAMRDALTAQIRILTRNPGDINVLPYLQAREALNVFLTPPDSLHTKRDEPRMNDATRLKPEEEDDEQLKIEARLRAFAMDELGLDESAADGIKYARDANRSLNVAKRSRGAKK